MNVILVEDEYSATQNMLALLAEIDGTIRVRACLESIETTVIWLREDPHPDLAFFDIQLADGLSFDIVHQTKVDFPIIFTTAYQEYALRAFKVNSIDYLLKPIIHADLINALTKYKNLSRAEAISPTLMAAIEDIRKNLTRKKTLLIKRHDGFLPIPVGDFACFYTENMLVYGLTLTNQTLPLNENLDNLERQLPSDDFFR